MAKAHPPLALIAGPTASGKSALALDLAERTGGVIVNADSAQVYRDLPVLSAAPGAADRARAEHRLYGFLDGAVTCSAADWSSRAKAEIADIHSTGRMPILVGGTGLYLRTLLDGHRAGARDRSRRSAPMCARLRSLTIMPDSPTAIPQLQRVSTPQIQPASPERLKSPSRPAGRWRNGRSSARAESATPSTCRPLILLPPRDWLYARCDRRFATMIEDGAVEEVEALLARGLSPSLPVMRAIGVREIGAHVERPHEP